MPVPHRASNPKEPTMYRRILVPVDGSSTARRALDEAIALADLTGAAVRVLHVVDEPLLTAGLERLAPDPAAVLEMMERGGQAILAEATDTVRGAGIACEGTLATALGHRVAEVIVKEAQAWDAELIVLGTHGRRGVDRFLLGSDAERVLRLAPMPVLVVRGQSAPAARRA
jgi:nucleotide-binding universal stress UspA family protein